MLSSYEMTPWQQRRITYGEAAEHLYTPDKIGSTCYALLEQHVPLIDEESFAQMTDFLERLSDYTEVPPLKPAEASLTDVLGHLKPDDSMDLGFCFYRAKEPGGNPGWYMLPDTETEQAFNVIHGYQDSVDFLISASQLVKSGFSEKDQGDSRVDYVQGVIDDFLVLHPGYKPEDFDPKVPGSFTMAQEFSNYYFERLEAEIREQDWPGYIDSCRLDFIQAINTPAMRQLVPKSVRERTQKVAVEIPITITDPLSALLARHEGWELHGSFRPKTRTIVVDPFTIGRRADKVYSAELKTTEDHYYMQRFKVKGTIFHELMHAISNHEYRMDEAQFVDSDETDASLQLQQSWLWPRYWNEGMTEKISTLALAEIEEPKYRVLRHDEEPWRLLTADSPRHILQSKKVTALSKQERSSYDSYRLLIDTMFAKLDWEAADLKPWQAERLAAKAFTEIPGEADTSYRLQFIQAINKAAHLGFFMKLGVLSDQIGVGLLTDMMLDPAFDPHDPQALPWLVSPAMKEHLNTKLLERFIKDQEESYQRMMAHGAPKHFLMHVQDGIKERQAKLRQAVVLEVAVDGLRHVLMAKYLGRKPYTAERQLMLTINGPKYEGMIQYQRTIDDLDEHQVAIDHWVKEAREVK